MKTVRALPLLCLLTCSAVFDACGEDFRQHILTCQDFQRVAQSPNTLPSGQWDHWVLMPYRYQWGQEYHLELANKLRQWGFNGAVCDGSVQGAQIHEQMGFLWYLDHAAGKGDLHLRSENTRPEDRQALFRPVCLVDTLVRDRLFDRLEKSVGEAREYPGRIAYALDDEVSWSSFTSPCRWDNSPQSMADFRRWLIERYGSREAVMEQWGSGGERYWERMATPDDFQDLYQLPWPRWNLSPWADAISYMDSQICNLIGDLVAQANAIDKLTPAGIVGGQCPAPYGGYDYAKLMRKVQFLEAYDLGCSAEIARSMNPGNLIPLVKTGFGEPLQPENIWFYWHHLAHGDRGVIVWAERWFQPDGVPQERISQLGEVIGQLAHASEKISAGEWMHDGVAIYYSHPSIQASWFIDCQPHGRTWINRSSSINNMLASTVGTCWAWTKLLEDAGLQYNFYSYADLLERGIDPQEYKVLILPRALALSDEEADEMARYVQAGGHLVADHSPGWFDQHLRGRARPVLDDLFGIGARPVAGPGQLFGGQILAELNAERHHRSMFVAAAAATWDRCRRQHGFVVAERDLPTFIEKSAGMGWANLLNVSIMEYVFLRTFDYSQAEAYRAPIEALLGRAGVEPWLEVRIGGKRPERVETTRWRGADRVVVCVIRNPLALGADARPWEESIEAGERVPLRVIFSGRQHDVIDERTGEILGAGSEFEVPWTTCEAAMLSFRR